MRRSEAFVWDLLSGFYRHGQAVLPRRQRAGCKLGVCAWQVESPVEVQAHPTICRWSIDGQGADRIVGRGSRRLIGKQRQQSSGLVTREDSQRQLVAIQLELDGTRRFVHVLQSIYRGADGGSAGLIERDKA